MEPLVWACPPFPLRTLGGGATRKQPRESLAARPSPRPLPHPHLPPRPPVSRVLMEERGTVTQHRTSEIPRAQPGPQALPGRLSQPWPGLQGAGHQPLDVAPSECETTTGGHSHCATTTVLPAPGRPPFLSARPGRRGGRDRGQGGPHPALLRLWPLGHEHQNKLPF